MHKNTVQTLIKLRPRKIVYVSCNSATQARDLALLKNYYEIVLTQAVDMFPQTYHVENIAVLERKQS
jgi:23S rRNA (uracil1939-C5)-methyltransferase